MSNRDDYERIDLISAVEIEATKNRYDWRPGDNAATFEQINAALVTDGRQASIEEITTLLALVTAATEPGRLAQGRRTVVTGEGLQSLSGMVWYRALPIDVLHMTRSRRGGCLSSASPDGFVRVVARRAVTFDITLDRRSKRLLDVNITGTPRFA